jgi:hypothetical protein
MLNKKALSATAGAPKVFVEDVFSCFLYTGNGSTQTITNNIDLSGEGGLVWCKFRNDSVQHALYDTVRGVQKELNSAGTGAEITRTNGLTSFSSTGFVLGSDSVVNQGSAPNNYASWTFRKAEKFFDVVTFTTNASGGATVSHALGSTPGCVIIKSTGISQNWFVYHRGLTTPNDYMINLNTTAAEQNQGAAVWSASSSAFTINNGTLSNSTAYVAYLFAHDAGGFGDAGSDSIIKCGSYSGTGTTNFISLGWEPQWVLVKRSDSTGDWHLLDNMRGWVTDSSVNAVLFANTSGDEGQSASGGWPAATGFYAGSGAYTSSTNTNGGTYIYIAIRRGPMKTPTTGTSVFNVETLGQSSGGVTPGFRSGWPVDMNIVCNKSTVHDTNIADRMRGQNVSYTNLTSAETSNASWKWDQQLGIYDSTATSTNVLGYMFRRAPGFFDVVCYTGTGSTGQVINHNLSVIPEMVVIKRRDGVIDWFVYHTGLSAGNSIYLNTNAAQQDDGGAAFSRSSTALTIDRTYVSTLNTSSATYVAYLFASVNGVSKVGTYTGNGSSQTINCGFTAGARFILIKRTDSTGDWYVYDSARGIVSGNDPQLKLNSTAAEATGYDAVDPDNSGFIVNNDATNFPINVNSATYIFYAVA